MDATPPARAADLAPVLSRERAEALARRWATCWEPGVHTELEITEVDGGYLVDLAVYRGRGPFERLGCTVAVIDHDGRIHVLDAA
jgi:hypothetical protein